MNIEFNEVDGVKRVSLTGRLDSAGVDAIEMKFTGGIVPAGQNTLVDLSHVDFLASLGVRMFVSTTRALSRKGGKLVLFGATPQVMEVIETMGFDDIVPIVKSEADALSFIAA
jgi:anti-anti-sigma factor